MEDIQKLKETYTLSASYLFIYLCVSPELYVGILTNLEAAGLLQGVTLLIEKPFGSDLKSAQALQRLLLRSFTEEQIYRVDHFLAKEAMQGLSSLSNAGLASIEVYLNEAFGVETRGAMYDGVGALRDVGQNHLLEAAAALFGDRTEALKHLHTLAPEEVATATMRAQHAGYQEIPGVAPQSSTETHFRVESYFEKNGETIPLLLEAGKLLPSRREVVVTLKSGEKKIIPFESGANEYTTLFKEFFAHDRSRFVSMQEVEALWRFVDPIEKEWAAGRPPLLSYLPHTGEV